MRYRYLALLGALVVVVAGSLALVLTEVENPANAAGPARSSPRMPWGHPDISGVWTSTGMRFVPLERARQFGPRDALNDREAARREALGPDNGPTLTPDNAERKSHTSRQASLVVDPPDGRIPLTSAGLEELKKREKELRIENPERSSAGTAEMTTYELSGGPLWRNNVPASAADVDLWDRCITRGLPGAMVPTAYNNAFQIMQTPDHVVIWYELLTRRIIPLDGRPHLNVNISHWDGDARGRWEGDTLVVDTTNFKETRGRVRQYGSFDGGTAEMRLVERFTRVDTDTIKYEGTVVDPTVFRVPWTLSLLLEREDRYRLFEYACHEGNYSMDVRLSGARADSDAGEAGKDTDRR